MVCSRIKMYISFGTSLHFVGKQTKNPPRQKALTRQNTLPDKRPSTVWTIFYESEEVEGLLSVSSDKRPSYVGETKGPPFSY